jgi:hypothetical protein
LFFFSVILTFYLHSLLHLLVYRGYGQDQSRRLGGVRFAFRASSGGGAAGDGNKHSR